jgi:predicted amidohydrolase
MYRIGFVQFRPIRGDVQQNIRAVEELLRGREADLFVLPELANSGYLYATPQELAPFAEAGAGTGPFLSRLRLLARQTRGVIVAGFAETSPEGLYNSAAAVDETGVVLLYRKTHLFANEHDLFLPGNSGFRILEHRGVRIGIMVCFDWIFPEAARTLALTGAQIIAHPANLVLPYCQQAMLTRSLENGVFSVTTNRYGFEELGQVQLNFTGASQIVDARGQRLLQAPQEGDAVAVCEIDPAQADNKQITPRNHLFLDRRPEMYRCAE